MIVIRPLALTDESFLWGMLYQALYVPAGAPPLPREIVHAPEISRYVQNWGKPDDFGFMALDDGKPIGAVWLRLLTGKNRGYGYIDATTPELTIAVLPEHRGQGVGSHLLSYLIEAAQSHYSKICLSVSPGNPAKRLYERFGFATVKQDSVSFTMVKRW